MLKRILKFSPYFLVLILAAFTSFEDFILKFLPVPDSIFFYSRFLSEFSIYLALGLVIFSKIISRIPLVRTPLDLPIFFFLASALISMLVNHSPILGSIVNIRPWLRFFVLFYLIVNIDINLNQAIKIKRTIIWAGTAQVFIGIIQFLSRGALNNFLLPRATDVEVGGVSKSYVIVKAGREAGSIYGAAGDTVIYAVFMILIFILILSQFQTEKFFDNQSYNYPTKNSNKDKRLSKTFSLILILCLFTAISLTYVRSSIFAAALIGIIYSVTALGKLRTAIVLSIAMILAFIIFVAIPPEYSGSERTNQRSITADITGIFTPEYIHVAKKQRLGALIGTVPTVISNKPFLGYGADQTSAIDKLNASKISFLTKVWTIEGFKDVYWVALLTFYGLSGVISIVWMFWRLHYCAVKIYKFSQDKITKEISLSVKYIVLVTSFLLFFNRAIEFRIFGFYFWLLPGLMFRLYLFQNKNQLEVTDSREQRT